MSEPLTKDKIVSGMRNDYVDIKDLKIAFEEFDKSLRWLNPAIYKLIKQDLKKAFPAIYEVEK